MIAPAYKQVKPYQHNCRWCIEARQDHLPRAPVCPNAQPLDEASAPAEEDATPELLPRVAGWDAPGIPGSSLFEAGKRHEQHPVVPWQAAWQCLTPILLAGGLRQLGEMAAEELDPEHDRARDRCVRAQREPVAPSHPRGLGGDKPHALAAVVSPTPEGGGHHRRSICGRCSF